MYLLNHRNRFALSVVAALLGGLSSQAANAELQARDLDGNASTTEAFYDTALNLTWVANGNLFKTQYDANPNIIQDMIAGAPAMSDQFSSDPSGNHVYTADDWTDPNGAGSGPGVNGAMNAFGAHAWVSYLNSTQYGGVSSWTLPEVTPRNGTEFDFNASGLYDGTTDSGYRIESTTSPLSHLYYVTLGNQAGFDLSGNEAPGGGLLNSGPFTNLQNAGYWYGTAAPTDPFTSWYFYNLDGSVNASGDNLFSFNFALAVAAGDVAAGPGGPGPAPVPVPAAVWLLSSALAGLGILGRRKTTPAA